MVDIAKTPELEKWCKAIETYDSKFEKWESRAKKIIKRYRDERSDVDQRKSQFNILWSNIQTLLPAVYANPPTPNIDRRYKDNDDQGRYASMVLERTVSYFVKSDIMDKVMKQVTLDKLLVARGVAWVRYCPVFEEEKQVTDSGEASYGEGDEGEAIQEVPELRYEDVIPDYVHWEDFGHTWARTWQEVTAVWRRVYMTRSELVKRFGEMGQAIPLDADIKDAQGKTVSGVKACIYEIWDKEQRKVHWISKGMEDVIETADDPLRLKDFFPCPEPAYSNLTNDDLIPTPDYAQYQDQAHELDMITARIAAITRALRVAGVYDGKAEGIDRLLSEGAENKLIPVQNLAMIGEGKGLAGVVSFFPLGEIVQTLASLYEARERVKQDLYEITGISDIVRGASNASETATAQQIKGQYASMRLDSQQKDIARFARDLVVIMTEIIAEHFSPETIAKISGVKLLSAQQKQQIEQQQMMAQQSGQQKPVPEEIAELLPMPTWDDVFALIKDDTARCFRIDIETDSTIKADQEAEKQARTEFLGAVSGFMQTAMTFPPDLQPLAMQMLMFGVRGFKVSRDLETAFEDTLDKLSKAQEQAQAQPQQSPEEMAAQAEMQRTQAQMQIEQQKAQTDMQMAQMKAQADAQKGQIDLQLKQADIEIKRIELLIKQAEIESKRTAAMQPEVNNVAN